jgi:hypothetical protein
VEQQQQHHRDSVKLALIAAELVKANGDLVSSQLELYEAEGRGV